MHYYACLQSYEEYEKKILLKVEDLAFIYKKRIKVVAKTATLVAKGMRTKYFRLCANATDSACCVVLVCNEAGC